MFKFRTGKEILTIDKEHCPIEVSWADIPKPDGMSFADYNSYRGEYKIQKGVGPDVLRIVPRATIHPGLLNKWDEFCTILLRADRGGRIDWRPPGVPQA